MAIGRSALWVRNQAIKTAQRKTRERRARQECRTFTVKVDYRKLTVAQRDALNGLFRDAKHLYNDVVSAESIKGYVIPSVVTVTLPDGTREERALDHIGAQTKQGIVRQAKDNIKSLAGLKKTGHKVGALKRVKSVDSIPLKQFGRTYAIHGSYIRVEKVPGWMHVTGMRQIGEGWKPANAKLLRKASGYYLAVTCYRDKTDSVEAREPEMPIGGMDAGMKTDLTESDGTETNRRYPDTGKARYWARRMSKRDKNSRGWRAANRLYRKEQERLQSQRTCAAREEYQRLVAGPTPRYGTLVVQDEQIANWIRSYGGAKLHGGILGRLYAMLKTDPHVIVLNKWQPTTAWCRLCGCRTPTPPSERIWRCAYCGAKEKRDLHSALNMIALKDRALSHGDLRKPRDVPVGPYCACRAF